MTNRRTASFWLVLPALGVMTWTAAGCSSGTPSADPAIPVTASAAISDPAKTPIPAPASVAAPTEVVDTSVPQELPPVVEAVDPAAKNIESALDATVTKAAGEVQGALDGGDARSPAQNTPSSGVLGDTMQRASGKVKQGVAQSAGQISQGIEQEVKQTASQLEQNARDRVQSATNGIAKSIDAKANGMKNAAKGAMNKGLDKAKSEILKEFGETPKSPTP